MYVDIVCRDKEDMDRNDLFIEIFYGYKCKWLEGVVVFIVFRDMYVLFWVKYCMRMFFNLVFWKYFVWFIIWVIVYMLMLFY